MEIEEDEEDEESSVNFIKLKTINSKLLLLIFSKKHVYSIFNFKNVLETIPIPIYVAIYAAGRVL
jgi:hypothetical protein